MIDKKKKVVASLLIALCLVAIGGLMWRQYTGTISGNPMCRIIDTKSAASPTGKQDAVVEFLDCGESGSETLVLLYQRPATNRAGVLIRIKKQSVFGKTQPVPAEINWVAATELEVHVPQKYIPDRKRTDWYGANINFEAIE